MEAITFIVGFAILLTALMGGIFLFHAHQRKKFREIAEALGSDVTVTGWSGREFVIQFDRGGTRFSGTIRRVVNSTKYIAGFALPPSSVHFSIRSKSFATSSISARYIPPPSDTWHKVTSPLISDGYQIYSRHPAHLEHLLADADLRVEIVKYNGSWGRYVDIWMEHGQFEVTYHADGLNRVARMRDVLETAVVFHDRLKIMAM